MVSTGNDTISALRPRYTETMDNSNILPFSHIFTLHVTASKIRILDKSDL